MENNDINLLVNNLLRLYPILYKKLIKSDRLDKSLSIPHLQVLFLLDRIGEQSTGDICKKTEISKPQMTVVIDKLISKKLVERINSETDRRVINITLTENGADFIKKYRTILREDMKNKLNLLSVDDLSELLNASKKVVEIASKIQED
ncbi:DNA-binding transcriptional regulator, MarR family [Clostridium cavendishii DSM 21758]|uniref:DNA-binding transcriptional regulator, MarR family n=1 Tax=Clostridium cavendishii DSM 21758 TaxID=1121302 RepID=A0A1M6VKK3_9CLOT|nr:MarR family transcriptional regulator [Clostridium cavendishii]SHK82032.1 DNA-binding transcriptional regulator, MarR family [Clostridium cavendishii DSM 21758]